LDAQDFPADEYEVLVVVDGSQDDTADFVRGLHPRHALGVLEHQQNRGQAAAKNTGLRAARGDLVLFLDDDLTCPPGLVRDHVAAHGLASDLVVFGPIFTADDSRVALSTDWWADICLDDFRRLAQGAAPEWPTDAFVRPNSSVRRAILVASGGFDERLSG